MTCTIYNHALNREMDRLFDNLLERTGLIQGDRYASIPVCIWEEPDRYCIELDLPGVKKEDIQVSVQKGMLRITAQRHCEEVENRKCWRDERLYEKFERTFTLPDSVDSENVDAEFVNGVLILYLKKKPEANPTAVQIK